MQVRRIVPLAVLAVAAAGAYLPASAATPKPISKSYEMSLLPVSAACEESATDEIGRHSETFTAAKPGKLSVLIEGFQGDWDLTLSNADGAAVAIGGGSSTGPDLAQVGPTERLIYKITKPGKYTVTSCNFLGSVNAKGSYTFTPNK